MTYSEAIQYLYRLQLFGASFGLETTIKLAAAAGHPEGNLRFIHVAGTNGKGSTCAMLESIYRRAGLRVGLYTSPHLISFRERIQIDRRPIPEVDLARLVDEFQTWMIGVEGASPPTFFEAVTVVALKYFAEQRCDLVIWETGLGGRLDATNIVTPLASVITNVEFDHEKWLGNTLAEIAFEKAGIIKPGVPAFTATANGPALEVIQRVAREKSAPLSVLNAEEAEAKTRDTHIGLAGEHQQINAALAVTVVDGLSKAFPVNEETIAKGLTELSWPGRLQSVREKNGRQLLLDGAHNPAGAKTLVASLKSLFPSQNFALILGVMRDKNWEELCRILAPCAVRVVTCRTGSDRAASPGDLAAVCRAANPEAEVTTTESVAAALEQTRGEERVVIAGSLYLIGEALCALGIAERNGIDEMQLNDWKGDMKADGR